jgi:nucleoside-diphosphate kinase
LLWHLELISVHAVINDTIGWKLIKQGKELATMERTLAIIKPDGVSRGLIGEVIKRLEGNDFNIVALKMLHLTKKQAEGFYDVHKGKPFFESLTDFMSSGPAVVMILEGQSVITRYRDLMGATNYKEAAEGTIRREFATDIEKNVVHGSDAAQTASFEMAYFFNNLEIVS